MWPYNHVYRWKQQTVVKVCTRLLFFVCWLLIWWWQRVSQSQIKRVLKDLFRMHSRLFNWGSAESIPGWVRYQYRFRLVLCLYTLYAVLLCTFLVVAVGNKCRGCHCFPGYAKKKPAQPNRLIALRNNAPYRNKQKKRKQHVAPPPYILELLFDKMAVNLVKDWIRDKYALQNGVVPFLYVRGMQRKRVVRLKVTLKTKEIELCATYHLAFSVRT